jgi:hypothetical protein
MFIAEQRRKVFAPQIFSREEYRALFVTKPLHRIKSLFIFAIVSKSVLNFRLILRATLA